MAELKVLSNSDRKTSIRALFLVGPGVIPARAITAWRESGYDIAEIWISGAPRLGAWARDRRLGWFAPQWSLVGAIRRWSIRYRHIESMKSPEIAELIAALEVDVIISVHFMRILPAELLSKLSVPVLNLHPSLLPAYRGPTPVVSMLLDEAQDRCGGVTLHAITPRIDAGPIFGSRSIPLSRSGDVRRWEIALARAAGSLLVSTVAEILSGEHRAIEQNEDNACYRRSTSEDLKLMPTQTSKRMAWLCSTLGRVRPLQLIIAGREYPVTGIWRHLGPPSGRPAHVGWWAIETDIADARVRLRRKPFLYGRRRRIETWWLRVLSPQ